ncbi:PAS domain S-box protein [Bizionia sediminis]|uniref:histidine kinase n=1 Tax=Bizionia sediminis TaxID=1737064 RepID=A0ABW5KQU3_9FLAO
MELKGLSSLIKQLETERLKNRSLEAIISFIRQENNQLKQQLESRVIQTPNKTKSEQANQQLIGVLDLVITRLFGMHDVYEIAREIASILAEYLGTNDCVIYAVLEDKQEVEQIAAIGDKLTPTDEIRNKLTLKFGEGIVGAVAVSGKPEIIVNTAKDSRYIPDITNNLSELTVPIILNNKVIGIIDSEHPDANFFNVEQLKTVESVARLAALKVKNALNIKERDQFERELLTSETRLSSLISSLEAGILLENENREIVLTNQKFCDLFQIPVPPETLIGQDCTNAAQESKALFKDPEKFTNRIDYILKTRKKVLADELVMVNDVVLERDYIPIFSNNEYLGHLWSYRDVSLSRNYQKSLEAQRLKYSNIISNMNLGLMEVDNEDRILMVNKSFEKMSGYKEHELVGKKGVEVFLDSTSKKVLQEQIENRIAGKSNNYEVVIKNKQGEPRHWLVSGGPNYNLNNELVGSIGIHLDISEQKRLAFQKESLLKKLKKSNEELEEYAHIVSHDLKSPLRNVSALANWIKTDNLELLKEESIEHFKQIELTLEKMDNLISGILQYASVSDDAVVNEEVDLNVLITTMIQTLHIPKNITITIVKQLPKLVFNKLQIQQVFQNLIMNAIEHANKPNSMIEIDYTETDTHYEVSVKDNGVGIETKYHKKIFKMFKSIHQKPSNSGIGLAIVKKILTMNGGDIRVESTLDSGATFFVALKK